MRERCYYVCQHVEGNSECEEGIPILHKTREDASDYIMPNYKVVKVQITVIGERIIV